MGIHATLMTVNMKQQPSVILLVSMPGKAVADLVRTLTAGGHLYTSAAKQTYTSVQALARLFVSDYTD